MKIWKAIMVSYIREKIMVPIEWLNGRESQKTILQLIIKRMTLLFFCSFYSPASICIFHCIFKLLYWLYPLEIPFQTIRVFLENMWSWFNSHVRFEFKLDVSFTLCLYSFTIRWMIKSDIKWNMWIIVYSFIIPLTMKWMIFWVFSESFLEKEVRCVMP